MLPSKERRQFAGKIHDLKKKHLNNMVMDGKLPLRPGEFLLQCFLVLPLQCSADWLTLPVNHVICFCSD